MKRDMEIKMTVAKGIKGHDLVTGGYGSVV
jgi:hypothetical protein